ncbi:hypothetical protein JCM6882_006497 [Rhodosporidiobolus microsporus]
MLRVFCTFDEEYGGATPLCVNNPSPSDTIGSLHAKARASFMDPEDQRETFLAPPSGGVSASNGPLDDALTLEQCGINTSDDSEVTLDLYLKSE